MSDFVQIVSVKPFYFGTERVTASIRAIDSDTVEIELSRPVSSVAVTFSEDAAGVDAKWMSIDGSEGTWTPIGDYEGQEGNTVESYVQAGTNAVISNPARILGGSLLLRRSGVDVEEVEEEKYGEGGLDSYQVQTFNSYENTSTTSITYSGEIRYRRVDSDSYLIGTYFSQNWPYAKSYSTRSPDADLDTTLTSEYQKMVGSIDSEVAKLDAEEAERIRIEEAKQRVEEAEALAEETGQSVTTGEDGELVVIPEPAQNFNEVAEGGISPFSQLETDSPLSRSGTYFVRSPLANTASESVDEPTGGTYFRMTVAQNYKVKLQLRVDGFPQSGEDFSEDYTLVMVGGDTLVIEWRGSDTPPILNATIRGEERLNYEPYAEAPGRFELAGAAVFMQSAEYTGVGLPSEGSATPSGGSGGSEGSEGSEMSSFDWWGIAAIGAAAIFLIWIFTKSRSDGSDGEE
jgi:hypothetical protein